MRDIYPAQVNLAAMRFDQADQLCISQGRFQFHTRRNTTTRRSAAASSASSTGPAIQTSAPSVAARLDPPITLPTPGASTTQWARNSMQQATALVQDNIGLISHAIKDKPDTADQLAAMKTLTGMLFLGTKVHHRSNGAEFSPGWHCFPTRRITRRSTR